MKCKKCGATIQGTSNFCIKCGYSIIDTNSNVYDHDDDIGIDYSDQRYSRPAHQSTSIHILP